jgi:hypothetical protein
MAWHAALRLDYSREGGRSVSRFAHDGPLRILQSLWPEGDAICHNVVDWWAATRWKSPSLARKAATDW